MSFVGRAAQRKMRVLPLLVLCIAQIAMSTPLSVYEVHSRDYFDTYDNSQGNSLRHNKDHAEYSKKHDRRSADLLTQARRRNNSASEHEDGHRLKRLESNLTEVLTNLSSVLNQILNIVKYTFVLLKARNNDYIPNNEDRNRQRIKRSSETVNDTVTEKVTLENTTEATNTSGRRTMMGVGAPVTNDEVRNKLFTYIEEGFNEIKYKVSSLQPIKTAFSNDVAYKIGYIVANIDTLDANMKNLKKDMDSDRYGWSDNRILTLYDTIKMSNSAVSNLMDVLKDFLERGVTGAYK
ncbi:hypothetical protein KGM_208102 [Danaus plexippus plexippus]|uniref:Uncharacterized protein n=1 Tax=Danaus plexippus plexippus TaxID=278856 RepID=A0A212FE83_DANPL|nr:hypothetical protein KGM_208102 [Danaus plexippus plexippus]